MMNFALVGCGGMGNWHATQLQKLSDDVRVVALCDIATGCAEGYKTKYFNDAEVHHDFDAMMDKLTGTLDAVVLCTPHSLHYPMAKSALQRGVHVLTDKPMVTSSAHAYDLWRLVKQTGRHLGITFQAPYTREYQAIKNLRDAGKLGTPQIIQGWLAQGWLKPTAGKWRQVSAISGGGQMYDSGSHVLNGMMWLMNEPVVEVYCMYDTLGSPVDINGVAIMKFRSGTLGSVAIGGNSPGWNVSILLQTDTSVVRTGPHGGSLEITRNGHSTYPPVPEDDHPAAFTPHRNFVNTLLKRESPVVTVRHGVLLSALMDAIYESARTKAPVKVEPVPDDL